MIEERALYVVKQNEEILMIEAQLLHRIALSNSCILWMNQGLYGLISQPRIRNASEWLRNTHDKKTLELKECGFGWDETLSVDAEIGKYLFNSNEEEAIPTKQSPRPLSQPGSMLSPNGA